MATLPQFVTLQRSNSPSFGYVNDAEASDMTPSLLRTVCVDTHQSFLCATPLLDVGGGFARGLIETSRWSFVDAAENRASIHPSIARRSAVLQRRSPLTYHI